MDIEPLYIKNRYDPQIIETKWQNIWAEEKPAQIETSQDLFAYSDPYNLGHSRFYIFQDFYSRYLNLTNSFQEESHQNIVNYDIEPGSKEFNKILAIGGLTKKVTPLISVYSHNLEHINIDYFAKKLISKKSNLPTIESVNPPSIDALRMAILRNTNIDKECKLDNLDLKGSERFIQRFWRLTRTDPMTFPNIRKTSKIKQDLLLEQELEEIFKQTHEALQRRSPHAYLALITGYLNKLYRYSQSTEGAHWETIDRTTKIIISLSSPAIPHTASEVWQIRTNNYESLS